MLLLGSHHPWDHEASFEIPSRYRYPHVVHRPLSPSVCCWFQICVLRCLFDIPLDCVTDNSQFTRYHLPEKLPRWLNCVYAFLHLQASCIPLLYSVATHFSVLAWRIPGTEEPGGLPSMGSHRVGQLKRLSTHACIGEGNGTEEPGGLPSAGLHRVRHDWSVLTAAAVLIYPACYF